jgi:hypothetical protein
MWKLFPSSHLWWGQRNLPLVGRKAAGGKTANKFMKFTKGCLYVQRLFRQASAQPSFLNNFPIPTTHVLQPKAEHFLHLDTKTCNIGK